MTHGQQLNDGASQPERTCPTMKPRRSKTKRDMRIQYNIVASISPSVSERTYKPLAAPTNARLAFRKRYLPEALVRCGSAAVGALSTYWTQKMYFSCEMNEKTRSV